MKIEEAKQRVTEIEEQLDNEIVVEFSSTPTSERMLTAYLSSMLKKHCRKKKIWKSRKFLITLKNVKYGINPASFRSKGGRDGIFLIDRDHLPYNEMQKKIFDQFIDKEHSGFEEILETLALPREEINAIRVVSHHLRLLGIHHQQEDRDVIVLVNFDETKG